MTRDVVRTVSKDRVVEKVVEKEVQRDVTTRTTRPDGTVVEKTDRSVVNSAGQENSKTTQQAMETTSIVTKEVLDKFTLGVTIETAAPVALSDLASLIVRPVYVGTLGMRLADSPLFFTLSAGTDRRFGLGLAFSF